MCHGTRNFHMLRAHKHMSAAGMGAANLLGTHRLWRSHATRSPSLPSSHPARRHAHERGVRRRERRHRQRLRVRRPARGAGRGRLHVVRHPRGGPGCRSRGPFRVERRTLPRGGEPRHRGGGHHQGRGEPTLRALTVRGPLGRRHDEPGRAPLARAEAPRWHPVRDVLPRRPGHRHDERLRPLRPRPRLVLRAMGPDERDRRARRGGPHPDHRGRDVRRARRDRRLAARRQGALPRHVRERELLPLRR